MKSLIFVCFHDKNFTIEANMVCFVPDSCKHVKMQLNPVTYVILDVSLVPNLSM